MVNLDVKQIGVNPLVHFLRYGINEGRSPLQGQPSFVPVKRKSRSKSYQIKVSLLSAIKKAFRLIPINYREKILAWSGKIPVLLSGRHFLPADGRNSQEGSFDSSVSQQSMIDIDSIPPATHPNGTIAIHLHIFYLDLIKEFVGYLENMPFPFDLYVSVPIDQSIETLQHLFDDLPFCKSARLQQVENRGRDIAPMLCTFGEELSRYDYVAHLHSKKSTYNKGVTEGWREYLCNTLLGSQKRIQRIISLLQGEQPCGIIYPQNFSIVPYWANTWLANKASGTIWSARLGIKQIPRGYFNFPAGSMFWARGDTLAPFFHAGITLKDFPEESGQTDGTLAHCLERLLVLCSLTQGMRPGIIKDTSRPSWSPWRYDQYLNRSPRQMIDQIDSTGIQLIAFDIFDTLLCRPLLNPETNKSIIARRLGGDLGRLFTQYRGIAEQQARTIKGQDVGLDEIYSQLGKLSGLSKSSLAQMKKLEEEIEEASLEPRIEVIDLYTRALETGKPVVLMSDMFLSKNLIEKILTKFGISGWNDFFLSNDIGLRKDTGELYNHVLRHYAIGPKELLMIGDNERSDVQIPCDMGASYLHAFRPVEMARGLPRLSNVIEQHERYGDLDAELTLGLVLRKNFAPLSLHHIDPQSVVDTTPYHWGYSLVGPLLVSFTQWLIQKAREDGIDRLYFLSREGKIIKDVYDQWSKGKEDAPKSDYLVISRRAAGVAAITSFEDILEIARTIFYPNTLESYLHTRYGLSLGEDRWSDIAKSLKLSRATKIKVFDHKIDHLVPLLQILEPDILSRARDERTGLLRNLQDHGLTQDNRQAVIDIGYGGSVQKYLNILLNKKVHGYYMMTEERALKVARTHDVMIKACLIENINTSAPLPTLYRYSFAIEKLLSSDDPQIEYYQIGGDGRSEGHFRDLTAAEKESNDIRKPLQHGAYDFTRDAIQVRNSLLPDFQPSCWTSQLLMEAFLAYQSKQEAQSLAKIALDDHYCGRGLVT